MKKLIAILLTAALLFSLASLVSAEEQIKTGLYVSIDQGSSKNATARKDGAAQADITLVAVSVDESGVITDCVIDMIQSKITFSAEGKITRDIATVFPSKNELGDAYGMRAASSIGREWNEQLAAFCEYVTGKTVEEIKGIAVSESGKAADADLSASVTLAVADYIDAVVKAAEKAVYRGAVKGDKLYLTTVTTMTKSKDATSKKDGQAQAYSFFGVITKNGDVITSCYIDAAQPTVKFNAQGVITSDLSAPVQTKDELGDLYGMRAASGLGKEWNEQAAAFCDYVVGKTVKEITGIAVNEEGKASDADLTASVTVAVNDMIELIAKTVTE